MLCLNISILIYFIRERKDCGNAGENGNGLSDSRKKRRRKIRRWRGTVESHVRRRRQGKGIQNEAKGKADGVANRESIDYD